jgi:uncharacterized protein (DUF58 family)
MQDTKQVLKSVKKVEIKTKKLVDGLLQGAYHSVFKGRGIEFSEVREYVPGDDIRMIDWKVTSRMNHPYVKEFIEERDLTVYILFDVSGSNEFGSIRSKKENAIELAASLMFAALKNNDKVGLCLFTEKVEKFIRAKKGKKHILRMISDLIKFNPSFKTTNLNETLKYVSKIVKKKSILFIISDFFSEDFSKPLSILKNRHDIIGININDLREQQIPDIGYINLEDEETGEQVLVNTSDKDFRRKYSELIHDRNETISRLFKKLSIDVIPIKSDEAFEAPMRSFFRMREKRMIR